MSFVYFVEFVHCRKNYIYLHIYIYISISTMSDVFASEITSEGHSDLLVSEKN